MWTYRQDTFTKCIYQYTQNTHPSALILTGRLKHSLTLRHYTEVSGLYDRRKTVERYYK